MASKSITSLERQTYDQDDSAELPPRDIVAYNELRSCADLYRLYKEGILEIQPHFQREKVWAKPDRTRFIDSLIKELPIPSMCFSYDSNKQKWQVIDGLQRMATIIEFLDGSGELSTLKDVDQRISGRKLAEFSQRESELYPLYTRVQNLSLPVTVIRCNYDKKSHVNYLFTIFHRLNSGGMRLNNQEIRNCIFSGKFNELLHELNKVDSWKALNKMKSDSGYRYRKQELILRIFAFSDTYSNNYKEYPGRLADYLNDYMGDNRDPGEEFIASKTTMFKDAVAIVLDIIFQGKPPNKISNTVLEALLVGVALNISSLKNKSEKQIRSLAEKLQVHEEFTEEKLREGLSRKQRVDGRMQAAKQIFSGK